MIGSVEVGSVPAGLGEDLRASVRTWREPAGDDMRATLQAIELGTLPERDASARKAQLVGPTTLVVFGEPACSVTAERLGAAAARIAGRLPGLEELWLDEPCLTTGTATPLAAAVDAVRAACPGIRVGVHTCGPPDAVERSGADVWHGDATRYERAWINLALAAPAHVEIVWGVVPTDATDDLADIAARIARIEGATGRPVRRIAPACGLGLRDVRTARTVLTLLERARRASATSQ